MEIGYSLEDAFNEIDDKFIRYATEESEFWTHYKIGVMDGLQYKQEKMYSEKEVKFQVNKLLNDLLYKRGFSTNVIGGIVNEWFEKFKKK